MSCFWPPEILLGFLMQDDLTMTLTRQCRESQYTVQMIVETAGDNEALLFEALNVNDEIQKVLSKYEDMKKPVVAPQESQPVLRPVAVEPDDLAGTEEEEALIRKQHNGQSEVRGTGRSSNLMDDLDNMIFRKTSSSSSSEAPKQKQPTEDDPVAH